MATVREMVGHAAYREIIDLGDAAVPWLLRELERDPDHWLAALKRSQRADPVPEECRGDLRKMTEYWTRWGRDNGYEW